MKLFYIANARIPTEKAHGIQIMQMCAAFSSYNPNNIEIELVIPKRFNKIKEDPFEYYGIEKNFKLKKLPCFDLIVFDKYIGHLGLWIEAITFFFFLFLYLLFKKADVIYSRDKFSLPLSFLKKNLFFEAHTFPKNYFLYSLFFKRLKGIIVITSFLKEFLIEKGVSPQKIMIAPDGVDLEKFDIECSKTEAREKLNLPKERKIVLYTGHLYSWKGATVLLEAARKFETLNSKFETLFVFVGGTEKDIKSFKFQVSPNQSKHGSGQASFKLKNVLVVGHRPYAEIPYWLKAADVLVLPNSGKEDISKFWTSPLKMFEYMASERPIVASDLPSIREILNDPSTGSGQGNAILVKPDSPQELAGGIKKVLENQGLADKISEQAYLDVIQYSWSERVKKILKFIS